MYASIILIFKIYLFINCKFAQGLKQTFFSVAFKMYDIDNDDLISKDELLAILQMMVGANIR